MNSASVLSTEDHTLVAVVRIGSEKSLPPFLSLSLAGRGFVYINITLLDGTNVRLNWNIESDLNVYWIKFKNALSLY